MTCGCIINYGDSPDTDVINYCPLHAVATMLLEALEAAVNMRDGRCGSCGCEIAPEGYCGCRPLKDAVANTRKCAARAAILAAKGASHA